MILEKILKDAEYYFQIGVQQNDLDFINFSIFLYDKIIKIDHFEPVFYYKRGLIFDFMNHYQKASQDIYNAILLDPTNDLYYKTLSKISNKFITA